MSEFRQNPVTKHWVLIAPSRGKRPDEYKTYSVMHGVPEVDDKCVFCPGSEHLNKEVERIEKKLSNEGFVAKAPAKVIEEERAKEKDYSEKRDAVIRRIEELKQI